MNFEEDFRIFFVLYDNGEVYYFTIKKNGEIDCNEFKKIFGDYIPGAHYIEFTEKGFNLQDEEGNEIYNLEDFRNTLKKHKLTVFYNPREITGTEGIYIDEDVRTELLEKGKLKFDEATSKILGISSLTDEKNTPVKTRKQNK